jgi:hypothetical protein
MMTLEDWEQLRDQLQEEKNNIQQIKPIASEPDYVSEGQQGYAAVDKEEE